MFGSSIDRDFCRTMTQNSLHKELAIIEESYMKIYDEYYSTYSRDSAFLKDLVDGIKGISAVIEVYTRDNEIHPSYALEKLNWTKSYVECVISYFEEKEKEINKGEEENGE